MLSSRSYYNNNDLEFYRRSESGIRMSLGQNSPLLDQYDTASQLSRRTTPSSEADKTGVTPRKRVPVACERCRKRKIKCSGDQGGNGCSNCVQAGVNNCQFLRVASIGATEIMQRAMYGRNMRYSPYPYSSPYRAYPSSHVSYSPQAHSAYQNMHNGVDYNNYGTPQNGAWPRPSSYATPYSPYEPESTSPYSSQPPSFMLPSTDPMSNGNTYLVNPYGSKSQPTQTWSDQSSGLPSTQSASQVMAAGYALPSSEALLSFQSTQGSTMSNLRAGQPLPYQTLSTQQPPTLSSDRTLPNPQTRYSSSFMNSAERQHTENTPLSAGSHRTSVGSLGWQTDSSSSASGVSTQTSCSSVGGSQDYGSERPMLQRESQDFGYNFIGCGNSPGNALSNLGDNQSSQLQLSTINTDLGTQRYRTIPDESSHQPPSSTSSTYGYAGATVTRNGQTRTSSGSLSNGTTYTRAQSGITRREPQECGPDCADCQLGSSRASIASTNNLSTY